MSPTYTLDPEEQEILDFIESGKWKNQNPQNFEELKKDLMVSAKLHRQKQSITIRLPRPLLNRIRAQASEEGIPYQTYIQSTLHKNVPESTPSR
jgi:predicted DNA binding CopG/RHH family protein